MTKKCVDSRACAFCAKICHKNQKKKSVCNTTASFLIENHPDAFKAVYNGKRKTFNEICHTKCANKVKKWAPPPNSTSDEYQVVEPSSNSPGLPSVADEHHVDSTNQNNSSPIGPKENSPKPGQTSSKRLFAEFMDEIDKNDPKFLDRPLKVKKREDVEMITMIKDKDDRLYVYSPSKHFVKLKRTRGRPTKSDHMIDFCEQLHSKCLVPSSEIGKVIQTSEGFLLGVDSKIMISTQTAIRGFITKSVSSDIEIAQWLAKQKCYYILVDGASYEDRSFIQFNILGYQDTDGKFEISAKQVSGRFLQVYETYTGTTGAEIALKIEYALNIFAMWQEKLKLPKIFNLTDLTGICFDTTSENTGKFGGIGAKLEELRQAVSQKLFKKPCTPLHQSKCIDHVLMLIFTLFIKTSGQHMQTLWPGTNLVNQEGVCLIFAMMECFGNFFQNGHGSHIAIKIKESNKTKPKGEQLAIPNLQDIDSTRYLSYGNLAEILVDYDDFIMPYLMDIAKLKGKLSEFTQIQQKYWVIYQNPVTFFVLDLLKMLKCDWVAPLMEFGNKNYDWNGFATQLQLAMKRVSNLKHIRINQIMERMNRRIRKWNLPYPTQITLEQIKSMYQFLGTTIQTTLNKWYDCELVELKENKFVVCSNRRSERYISIIKWSLGHCKNMRVILLQAHMRLRNLQDWSFEHNCPTELKQLFRKLGSDLYNHHITRDKVRKLKHDHYNQLLETRLSKQAIENREEPIQDLLVSLGYLEKGKKVTCNVMKEFCAAGAESFEECCPDKKFNREQLINWFLDEIVPYGIPEYIELLKNKPTATI